MPLVSSYYSKVSGETKFHNHSDCKEGNTIKAEGRLQGTGRLVWCERCAELLHGKKGAVSRNVYPRAKKKW